MLGGPVVIYDEFPPMQLSDVAFLALLFGGVLGIALHPDTRLLTGLCAFLLFSTNLWTDVGGGFSFRVFFTTVALIGGALLWELLRLGRDILLWSKHHVDALLSRAESRNRHPARSAQSRDLGPTDGLWYLWRDRLRDDSNDS